MALAVLEFSSVSVASTGPVDGVVIFIFIEYFSGFHSLKVFTLAGISYAIKYRQLGG